MPDRETLLEILDLARWAPSGDNAQPWRFEIIGDNHVAVRGFDTREHVLYDFDGRPSQMAHGALLETLRIAATGFGLVASWRLRQGCADRGPIYDVRFEFRAGLEADPLLPFIESRTVQRRPMRTTSLTEPQRKALATAPGEGYRVRFFESGGARMRIARLLWDNALIRLTCPEALPVHRGIIEWGTRYSKDRIPEAAVGVDPFTAKLMRWAMQRWERVDFLNRYLFGTIPPRIQLDFLPAVCCAAHMLLEAHEPVRTLEDHVYAGVAMQRLWLTAAALGLHLQPEMTPLIFGWYVAANRSISSRPEIDRRARALAQRMGDVLGLDESANPVFFCRTGRSHAPRSRSVRKDLGELMVESTDAS